MSKRGEFEDPRKFLSRHALRPKDSFGQCFLIASPVAIAIVDALAAQPDETVIEIGTGTATLAKMIAPMAERVVAIERDRDLVAALRTETLPSNIELLEEDAAVFDYAAASAQRPTAIVGNLPYQITGKLLRAICAPPIRWRCAVIMVQREVAARLLASPDGDDWGVLGVFTSAACEVSKVVDAPPHCFHPAPRIVSTVVRLVPRAVALAEETPVFQRVVHALFSARRKNVLNTLSTVPNLGRTKAGEILERLGIESRRRAETLSLAELRAISDAVALLQSPT